MTHFQGKKVVVMGLGLHGGGVGAVKFLSKNKADVLITDLKTKEELKESIKKLKKLKVKYVLGRHRHQDFEKADLIIRNPDASVNSPYLKTAKKHKIPIETDISLFFKLSDGAFIIGITGTKGKSTVSTLAYKLIKSKYKNTFLAGNIGSSPLELVPKIKKNSKVVLELSSFALEDLKYSPDIALITNILPDHLNKYKSMKEYISAKKRVFKFQRKNDVLILNYEDPVVRNFSKTAKSKIYFFNSREIKNRYSALCEKKSSRPIWCEGRHNLSNVSAAVKIAKLLKIGDKKILRVLKSFKGVPFRQELVRRKNGIRYFNDTTATMPEAVCEAVKIMKKSFPKSRIILIAGGQDKKLDYKKMAKIIDRKVDKLVLLPGTASDKMKKLIKKQRKIYSADFMKDAVEKAEHLASQKSDIVLLSPGAASFNLFKNEFDRGEQFNKYVKAL